MSTYMPEKHAMPYRFSIVIATRNRSASLQQCLASIEHLDFPHDQFELLVVNDGSIDDTQRALDRFATRTPLTARVFHQPHAGISAARNRAIEASTGEFIAFTDDDCIIDPGWLQAFLHAFDDESIGGVGGTIVTDATDILGRYMEFHHILSHDPEGVYLKPALVTANACYRGHLVRVLGGFDLHARPTGEDLDLSWRVTELGYRLSAAPGAVVTHHFSPRLRDFPQRFYGYGVGSGYLQAKHKLGMELAPPVPLRRVLSPRYLAYKARSYRHQNCISLSDSIGFACLDAMRVVAWWLGYLGGPRSDSRRCLGDSQLSDEQHLAVPPIQSRRAGHEERVDSDVAHDPLASIVIATHNRVQLLRLCLASVEALRLPQSDFEVIVVDDGSVDETPAVLKEFAATTTVQFTHLRQKNGGPASARNTAIEHARGTFIAITDDDCIVHPDWLNELLNTFDAPDTGGVGGTIETRGCSLLSTYVRMHTGLLQDPTGKYGDPALVTANACYRADVLHTLGGFDSSATTGEDLDLTWRAVAAGYQLRLAEQAIVYHDYGAGWQDFARRYLGYGRGHALLTAKHEVRNWHAPPVPVQKALSLRYLAFKTREYVIDRHYDPRTALGLAIYDHTRTLAWWMGFAYGRARLAAGLHP